MAIFDICDTILNTYGIQIGFEDCVVLQIINCFEIGIVALILIFLNFNDIIGSILGSVPLWLTILQQRVILSILVALIILSCIIQHINRFRRKVIIRLQIDRFLDVVQIMVILCIE